MSVNAVNKTTGELVTLANGSRIWIGIKSAHDLAVQQGTMPNNCMVCITDESNSVLPDWSNAQSVELSTTEWEAPADGWLVGDGYLDPNASVVDAYVQINGVRVARLISTSTYICLGDVQVMISMGDKVKISSGSFSDQHYSFVPFKTL